MAYQTLKILTKTKWLWSSVIEDKSGNHLMECTAVLNKWAKYYRDLYTYKLHPDTSILLHDHTRSRETEDLPVLSAEVEDTM